MPAHKGQIPKNYKGDKASYSAKHIWASSHLGKPKQCDMCGTRKRKVYDWANISGEHKREVKDWVRLCRPCHRKFDGNIKLTDSQVKEIRTRLHDYVWGMITALAAEYNVDKSLICAIAHKRRRI